MGITIEREPTFKTALSSGINLFLGAGFPILASSKAGGPLPLGERLKTELCTTFECSELEVLSLARLYDVLFRQRASELDLFLRRASQSRITTTDTEIY